jgi:hypothetical protein
VIGYGLDQVDLLGNSSAPLNDLEVPCQPGLLANEHAPVAAMSMWS